MDEIPEIHRKKLLLFDGQADLTFQEIKVWKSFLGSMVEANKVYFDRLSESAVLIKKIGGEPKEIKRKLGQNSIYAAEQIQEVLGKIGTFHKDVFGDVAKYKDAEGEFKELFRLSENRFDVLRKNAAVHLREHEKLEKESAKAWKYYMRRMKKQVSLEKKMEDSEKHDRKMQYKSLKFASKTSTALSQYQACYQQEVKHRKHLEKQSECLRREFLREEKTKLNTMFKFINSTLGKLDKLSPQGMPGLDDTDFQMESVKTKQMARSSWDTYVKEKTFPDKMDEDPTQTVVRRFRDFDEEVNEDSDEEEEDEATFMENSVTETPVETFETPIQSFEITSESHVTPIEKSKATAKSFKTPVKSFKTSVECHETPVECLEMPIECLETPVECLQTPVQCLETPAKSVATPPGHFKTPMPDFKRPMSFNPKKVADRSTGKSRGSPAVEKFEDDLDAVLQDILDDETLFEDPPRKSKAVSKQTGNASPETVLHALTGSESNPALQREQALPSSIISVGPIVNGHQIFREQFKGARNKNRKVRFQEDPVQDSKPDVDGMQVNIQPTGVAKKTFKVTTILPSAEMEDNTSNEGDTQQPSAGPTVLDAASEELHSSTGYSPLQGMQTAEDAAVNNYDEITSYNKILRGEQAHSSRPAKESTEVQMRPTSNARRRRREAKADMAESIDKRVPLPPPFPQQSTSASATMSVGISPKLSDHDLTARQLELGPKTEKFYVYPICDWRKKCSDQLNLKRGVRLTQINSENREGFCYGYKKNKLGTRKFGFFPAALVSLTPQTP